MYLVIQNLFLNLSLYRHIETNFMKHKQVYQRKYLNDITILHILVNYIK